LTGFQEVAYFLLGHPVYKKRYSWHTANANDTSLRKHRTRQVKSL